MPFETNRFCWYGCNSTDTAAAKSFYTNVMGWSVQTMAMGDNEATMFAASDVPFAHLAEPPMEGAPSHWNNYLRVDDVDATAVKVTANGGKVVVPSTDIPPGRFSVVASPSGAMFTLFREAGDESAHHPGGDGSVKWVELHSTDLDADLAWLEATFGFTFETMEMPDGPYYLLTHNGEQRGGAVAARDGQSFWLTWIQVADVEDALGRVKSNGGNALSPVMEIPEVGRMAVIADPAGGVCGIITPPTS